jgi:hypothetical protein
MFRLLLTQRALQECAPGASACCGRAAMKTGVAQALLGCCAGVDKLLLTPVAREEEGGLIST